jgi:acid phosphatase
MVGSVEKNGNDGLNEIGEQNSQVMQGRGSEKGIKLGLSGCHDTTLAAVLASLGAFDNQKWPPYTSHIALELFRKADRPGVSALGVETASSVPKPTKSWFSGIFGGSAVASEAGPIGIARKKTNELSEFEKSKLDGYFVRVRYNDTPMKIPGCKPAGNHLEGDESFCTLVSHVT